MAIPEGLISQLWVVLGAIGAPLCLGIGAVRWLGLRPEHGRRAAVGYGYLLGQFLLAQATLLWLVLGQPVPGMLLPLVALAAGAVLWRQTRRRMPSAVAATWPQWIVWLPLLLLAVWLLDCSLATNTQVIRFGDEAEIWAAKAKVLYSAPVLDPKLALPNLVKHADYPLFNPLVQVLAFASCGRTLQYENRLPIQAFGFCLLLLLSAAMTRRAHPLAAAAALFAFAGTTFARCSVTADADVMLACAVLAAVEALLRWRETGEAVWWRLAALALAAMLMTKNEGAMLAVAVTVPFAVGWWRERRRIANPLPWREAGWLLLPAATVVVGRVFNGCYHLHNDLMMVTGGRGMFARILDNLSTRLSTVTGFYGRLLVDPAQQRLLLLGFLVALPLAALHGARRPGPGGPARLYAVLVMALCGYMLVFVGTNAELLWHLTTAAHRTVLHVLPLAALGLVATVWPRAPVGAATAT